MFGAKTSEPVETVKRHPVLAMPKARALEEEFAEFVPANAGSIRTSPGVGDSRSMKRVQEILGDGLTAAFKDGGSALTSAIEESEVQVKSLAAAVATHAEQFDAMKRQCAEYLMAQSKHGEQLARNLDTSIARLHALTKYLEDDRAAIESPPKTLPLQGGGTLPAAPEAVSPPPPEDEPDGDDYADRAEQKARRS
jgi:hypothetical protein